jgi:hypothetical protein
LKKWKLASLPKRIDSLSNAQRVNIRANTISSVDNISIFFIFLDTCFYALLRQVCNVLIGMARLFRRINFLSH